MIYIIIGSFLLGLITANAGLYVTDFEHPRKMALAWAIIIGGNLIIATIYYMIKV